MKTITIYELLGIFKDEHNRSIYVKYFDRVNKKEDVMFACKDNIIYKLEQSVIELNDEVEILEEEKKIPEKIKDKYCSQISKVELAQKYNEIIDYLKYHKSKGDE